MLNFRVFAFVSLICCALPVSAAESAERGMHRTSRLFYEITADSAGTTLYLINRLTADNTRRVLARLDNASFGSRAHVRIVQVEWDEVIELLAYVVEVRRPSAPVEYQVAAVLDLNPNLQPRTLLSPATTPELIAAGDTARIISTLPRETGVVLALVRGAGMDRFVKLDLFNKKAEVMSRQTTGDTQEYWVDEYGTANLRVRRRGAKFIYETRGGTDVWKTLLELPAEKTGADPRPIRMLRAQPDRLRYLVAARAPETGRFAVFNFHMRNGLEPKPAYADPASDIADARFVEGQLMSYCRDFQNGRCEFPKSSYGEYVWKDVRKKFGERAGELEVVDVADNPNVMLLRAPRAGGKWEYFTYVGDGSPVLAFPPM